MIENSFFYHLGSVESSDSHSRFFDSFFIGSTFGKGYFLGWNTNYSAKGAKVGAETIALTGYEMGPKFGKLLNKTQTLSIAVVLNPLVRSTATLSNGAIESWSGLGAQGEITYAPQVGKSTWFGIKIIFDYVIFNQKTDSGNTTSTMNAPSPSIMPTLYLGWRFI